MDAQYPGYPLPPSPLAPAHAAATPDLIRPAGVDGRAKTALLCGILGFAGFTAVAGVVFAFRGLRKTRRTRQQGRAHAIAGLALSTAWLSLFGTVGAYAVATGSTPPARDAAGRITAPGTINLLSLHIGDCFRAPAANTVQGVTATPCHTAHDAEAFARPAVSPSVLAAATQSATAAPLLDPRTGRRVDTTPYPGPTALQADATTACQSALDAYVYDSLSLPSGVQTISYIPEPASWTSGVRTYVCVLQSPHGISRPLREDASVLNPDQARYLQAVAPFNRQVAKVQAASDAATTDLAKWRSLAADLAAAARREDDVLSAGPWPSDRARRAITDLVAVQKRAIPLYDLAAQAANPRDARDVLTQALDYVDGTDAYTARKALGLSTSQGQAPNTEPEIA